jgi:ABC-type multidrug transport system ATPase subunit
MVRQSDITVVGMANHIIKRIIKLFDEICKMHDDNVIDLWSRDKKKKNEDKQVDNPFAAEIEENRRRKERQEKERLDQNKGVLRSYRIKN